MTFIQKLLALFGFAPRDVQAVRPPIFAWLGLTAAAYFAANIIELLAGVLGPRWSVYLRTVGVVSTALVVHAAYRAAVHQDDHSWGGWIRRQLIG